MVQPVILIDPPSGDGLGGALIFLLTVGGIWLGFEWVWDNLWEWRYFSFPYNETIA